MNCCTTTLAGPSTNASRATLRVSDLAPRPAVRLLGRCADALGWLGWRSPLRSTALTALEEGVIGDPRAWTTQGGPALKSFEATLMDMPATAQERRFAQSYLIQPLAIGTLALFWLLSGAIGLWRHEAAAALLTERGMGSGLAMTAVLAGVVADLTLGLAVLYRPWARRAALGAGSAPTALCPLCH